MMSTILVTGGTGTLGRHVVQRLRDAGCDVRVLSRRSHPPEGGVEFVTGDLATGEGIEAVVAGVGTVVHCAGSSKGDEGKALNLADLVRGYLRARYKHRPMVPIRLPGGCPRVPSRRESVSRTSRGSPDLGGLPS